MAAFSKWFLEAKNWHGKERDCVNLFAHNFLAGKINHSGPIKHFGQIRIESPVPQPGFIRQSASKDIVIWKDCFTTAWNENYEAVNCPLVVIEWKNKRSGNKAEKFDPHDIDWLEQFTKKNPKSIGYLVSTYNGPRDRDLKWTKVKNGRVGIANRRS